jgi:hypothetical protein
VTAPAPTTPAASLRYLNRMTDANGIFEHALHEQPRRELGYCTDDAGRLLRVATRLPWSQYSAFLSHSSLCFLERAHVGDGEFRLRQLTGGGWTDDAPSDDANGRALLGLATAAAASPWPHVRSRALALFEVASSWRSSYSRATAYAAIGAAELLGALPGHVGALRLVDDARDLVRVVDVTGPWPWPEPRLHYANALLPDAALAVANALGDRSAANDALGVLEWLVGIESLERHFSFAPVGGRGPDDSLPAFAQQPIEAWAMSEACARAYSYSHDRRWADATRRAASWFLGNNDLGVVMFDSATGGGFDGLESDGANRNEGAESSMAFVAAMTVLEELASQVSAAPEGVGRIERSVALQAASSASSR